MSSSESHPRISVRSQPLPAEDGQIEIQTIGPEQQAQAVGSASESSLLRMIDEVELELPRRPELLNALYQRALQSIRPAQPREEGAAPPAAWTPLVDRIVQTRLIQGKALGEATTPLRKQVESAAPESLEKLAAEPFQSGMHRGIVARFAGNLTPTVITQVLRHNPEFVSYMAENEKMPEGVAPYFQAVQEMLRSSDPETFRAGKEALQQLQRSGKVTAAEVQKTAEMFLPVEEVRQQEAERHNRTDSVKKADPREKMLYPKWKQALAGEMLLETQEVELESLLASHEALKETKQEKQVLKHNDFTDHALGELIDRTEDLDVLRRMTPQSHPSLAEQPELIAKLQRKIQALEIREEKKRPEPSSGAPAPLTRSDLQRDLSEEKIKVLALHGHSLLELLDQAEARNHIKTIRSAVEEDLKAPGSYTEFVLALDIFRKAQSKGLLKLEEMRGTLGDAWPQAFGAEFQRAAQESFRGIASDARRMKEERGEAMTPEDWKLGELELHPEANVAFEDLREAKTKYLDEFSRARHIRAPIPAEKTPSGSPPLRGSAG